MTDKNSLTYQNVRMSTSRNYDIRTVFFFNYCHHVLNARVRQEVYDTKLPNFYIVKIYILFYFK